MKSVFAAALSFQREDFKLRFIPPLNFISHCQSQIRSGDKLLSPTLICSASFLYTRMTIFICFKMHTSNLFKKSMRPVAKKTPSQHGQTAQPPPRAEKIRMTATDTALPLGECFGEGSVHTPADIKFFKMPSGKEIQP